MSVYIDTLAELVEQSVSDSEATRQDWERALDQAFASHNGTGRPLVIGMTGLARSGKDTVGSMLVERHGLARVAFADGVREAALALDPIIEVDRLRASPVPGLHGRGRLGYQRHRYDQDTLFYRLSHLVETIGWDAAKAVPEVRRTLQRIGSEAGWMIHGQNLWIDLAARKITGPTVITDVRFAHEVDWLDSVGGLLWRVERPGNELALTGETATHASEAQDLGREPDAVIVNDGSLEDLAASVDALLKEALDA